MQISPSEIDDALLLHPAVDQAVTFPLGDPKFDFVIVSAVVLRPGETVRTRDLKWFAATHLAAFKVPQRILIVDAIPAVPRRAMARALGLTSDVRPSAIFQIQPHGAGSPLFVIGTAAQIQSDRPIYGIREPDYVHLPPPRTIEHAAAECIHALRRFQPDGPYAIAASESSRSIAIEMARQLEQAGERVEFLAIPSRSPRSHSLPYDREHSWPGRMIDMTLAGMQ